MQYANVSGKIAYRPYLDGLRGVAVIAVVLYHAKLLSVTGGFIGVDVFFVLSGFLITSIIARDLTAGTFSLLAFWERRIRRILPALFAVLFATIIAAHFLMLYPPDYRHLGDTVLAQSVFASNISFMLTDNYFDESSRFSPLLHTWSLSVEEQFYLLFPLVVLLCVWLSHRFFLRRAWPQLLTSAEKIMKTFLVEASRETRTDFWKGKKLLLAVVLAFGVASLFLSIWFADVVPSGGFKLPFVSGRFFWGTTYATAGFYLLPTRAWELAVGILLSLYAVRIRSRVLGEVLSAVGGIALIASVFLFNDGTAFPGVAALLPTLGVAAIIVANENHLTITGKFLSYSGLVWVGLISYSLYLWHWPLFVFANLALTNPPSKMVMAGLILVAVVIAWLSYRFIETPFRKKSIFPERKQIFLFGFGALAFLALSGFLMERFSVELLNRLPPAAENILLASGENVPWGGTCFDAGNDDVKSDDVCRIGEPGTAVKSQFVVWGDSHADALAPLFDELGHTYGVQGAVFDDAYCVPLPGVHEALPAVDCETENASALRYIRANDIRYVILAARWSYYVTGGKKGLSSAFITDSNNVSTSSAEAEQGKYIRRGCGLCR